MDGSWNRAEGPPFDVEEFLHLCAEETGQDFRKAGFGRHNRSFRLARIREARALLPASLLRFHRKNAEAVQSAGPLRGVERMSRAVRERAIIARAPARTGDTACTRAQPRSGGI